jgi:hypothetical protein
MKPSQLRPLAVGFVWGCLVGLTPFFEPISTEARLCLGLGLFSTYFSIGAFVTVIPTFAPRPLLGAAIGFFYSIPGAIFTMTPYPLRDDAPAYFLEFASGGFRAFTLTLLFGTVVGLTCALAKPKSTTEPALRAW